MKFRYALLASLLPGCLAGMARAESDTPADTTARLALPEIVVTATRTPERLLRVPAYALLGARVGYTGTFETRTIHAYVGVENLTDQRYVESVFINGASGQYFEPGLPRSVSAGLTLGL